MHCVVRSVDGDGKKMSRIGKQPVAIPGSVKLTQSGSELSVEGPLGKLAHRLPDGISADYDAESKQMLVTRATEQKRHKALHGLTRTLIDNMVVGVTDGYKKELELVGIGYSVKLEGQRLALQLGYANAVYMDIPEGLKVEVTSPTNPGRLVVSGFDKQQVGDLTARIRKLKLPEPYQGKGFRYTGEVIRRKAGKAFVGAG